MKIISLQASNFMKLVAVTITPSGNVVEITGKNGQGKSSVLRAIWIAIKGLADKENDTKLSVPIRKGQETARIRIDLGDLIVTREFRLDKDGEFVTSVRVENADGSRFPSPQAMLDGLLGELCLDPLAFARMSSDNQFEALRRFVPGVDFGAIDKANDTDAEKRKGINKRQKEAAAAAAGMTVSEKPPCEAVDESALVAELESAGEKNTDRATRQANREKATAKIAELRMIAGSAADVIVKVKNVEDRHLATFNEVARDATQQIQDMEEQIQLLQERIERARLRINDARSTMQNSIVADERAVRHAADSMHAEADALQKKLDEAGPLADVIDTALLRVKIDAARDSNQRLSQWAADNKKRDELRKLSETLAEESKALTRGIGKRTQEKDDAIAAAQMPVPGLGFGDGIVTMNGLPFDQASDAERLRTSVAIAMAANPKLRVIRIRDGSLLDEDSMKILSDMCDENEFQCWIETVSSNAKTGFVLEDGHLKDTGVSDE